MIRQDMLFETKPLHAEIRIQEETSYGAPRIPIWVRIRADEIEK
jgi:hypothetical protein